MPSLRTEITEIVTALGTTGKSDIESALEVGPLVVKNVSEIQWRRIRETYAAGTHQSEFDSAWANGSTFFWSDDGLRGRRPLLIEWKGSHNPPGFDFLPADLRIDHVFLISCKYLSRILANLSPANLFVRLLADRSGGEKDWYEAIAPLAYRQFYEELRVCLNQVELPSDSSDLTPDQLSAIRSICSRAWPESLVDPWRAFSYEVSKGSAEMWSAQMATLRQREEMLWRLLRFNPAPYFVLGASQTESLRLRIGTPWDWRQLFELREFQVAPANRGQPEVRWEAEVKEKASGRSRAVYGHVEVRWSHGRFSGVEAKVYLDIAHTSVPGYFPLI